MLEQNKGFSLIELLIALVILGIILSMAAPSVSSYKDKRRVIEVGEAVYGQLQLARSKALTLREPIYARFSTNESTTWRMGLSTITNCDVTQATAGRLDDCHIIIDDGDGTLDTGNGLTDLDDLVYYGLNSADFVNVIMGDFDGDATNNLFQITFDPVRGTATNKTIVIRFGTKYEMRVVVYMTGRIRLCSPAGATHVGGATEC